MNTFLNQVGASDIRINQNSCFSRRFSFASRMWMSQKYGFGNPKCAENGAVILHELSLWVLIWNSNLCYLVQIIDFAYNFHKMHFSQSKEKTGEL